MKKDLQKPAEDVLNRPFCELNRVFALKTKVSDTLWGVNFERLCEPFLSGYTLWGQLTGRPPALFCTKTPFGGLRERSPPIVYLQSFFERHPLGRIPNKKTT